MMLLLAALLQAEPTASPPVPIATPTAVATAAPRASYTPIPCTALVRSAKLAGKPITADRIGMLVAASLKAHGYRSGSAMRRDVLGMSVLDYVNCFSGETK